MFIVFFSNTQTPWTNQDYISLQGVVSKFKGLREQVQNTSVILERPFYDSSADSETKEVSSGLQRDNRRMDLETAVLMQVSVKMSICLPMFAYVCVSVYVCVGCGYLCLSMPLSHNNTFFCQPGINEFTRRC